MKRILTFLVLLLAFVSASSLTFDYGWGKYQTTGKTDADTGLPLVECIGIASDHANMTQKFTCTLRADPEYNGTQYVCRSITAGAFQGNKYLDYLKVEYGFRTIGANAFQNCSELDWVRLSSTVTDIGNNAFVGCASNLSLSASWLNLPNSGYNAFSSIGYLNLPTQDAVNKFLKSSSWSNKVNYGIRKLTYNTAANEKEACDVSLTYKDVRLTFVVTKPATTNTDGEMTLVGIVDGTELRIVSEVSQMRSKIYFDTRYTYMTSIAPLAFYQDMSITSVYIDRGKVTIGEKAFYGCTALTEVNTTTCVTSIGDQAFYNCSALTSVTTNATSIGDEAFYSCPLSSLTLNNSSSQSMTIGNRAFYANNLTEINIPSAVTSIGSCAFLTTKQLQTINVNTANNNYSSQDGILYNKNRSTLIYCPPYFSKLTALSYTDFPETLTKIEDYAFYMNQKLKMVEIPYGVTSIGYRAFGDDKFNNYNGKSIPLEFINIPSSVKTIGKQLFGSDYTGSSISGNLKHISINIKDWVYNPAIVENYSGGNQDVSGATLYLRAGAPKLFEGETEYTLGGKEITPEDHYNMFNKDFGSYDIKTNGNLYFTLDEATLTATLVPAKLYGIRINPTGSTINVPSSVTYRGRTYIVTTLGAAAFMDNTGLVAVNLPTTITTFEGGTGRWDYTPDSPGSGKQFFGCKALTSVTLPSNLKQIPYNCFANTKLKELYLPYGLEKLGCYAFEKSTLETLLVPSSVKSFDPYALEDATSLKTLILNVPFDNIVSCTWEQLNGFFSFPTNVNVYVPFSEMKSNFSSIAYQRKDKYKDDDVFGRFNIQAGAYDGLVGPTSGYDPSSDTYYFTVTKAATDENYGEAMFVCGPDQTIVKNVDFGWVANDHRYQDKYYWMTKIDEGAFINATNLTRFTLSADLKEIPYRAFSGTTSLTAFPFNSDHCKTLKSIGARAFYESNLTGQVVIPGTNLTNIGSFAFQLCKSISELVIKYHPNFNTPSSPIFDAMAANFKCYVDHRRFPYYFRNYVDYMATIPEYINKLEPCVIPEYDWTTISFPQMRDSSGKLTDKWAVSTKGLFDGGGKLYTMGSGTSPVDNDDSILIAEIPTPTNGKYGAPVDKGFLAHLKTGTIYKLEKIGNSIMNVPGDNYLIPSSSTNESNGNVTLISATVTDCKNKGIYQFVPTNDNNDLKLTFPTSAIATTPGLAYLSLEGASIKPNPLPTTITVPSIDPENYDLWLCGTQVNENNCNDLSEIEGVTVSDDGYARYNPQTKTLELRKANIVCDNITPLKTAIDGLTIKCGAPELANQPSTIQSTDVYASQAMNVAANTTITGTDALWIGGGYLGDEKTTGVFLGGGNLTLKDANIVIFGTTGIYSRYNGTIPLYSLTVDGTSNVIIWGKNHSVGGLSDLILGKYVSIISPEGAEFSNDYVRVGLDIVSGEPVAIMYQNPGDVNEDGDVNINDVVAIINHMAGTANWKNADVNGDDNVNINDVVAVINIMAGL